MHRTVLSVIAFLLVAGAAYADEASKADAEAKTEAKLVSGMSVVGNDEAPKSLVIVPWKSSELGHSLDVSKSMDDGLAPVDRDVFMRELTYYEIRTTSR
jgi:hypothetical protein